MNILPQLLGIKVRHNFIEDFGGCIGKKGAPYAARFWDLMNDWGVSRI
jgi:hypothetical protein